MPAHAGADISAVSAVRLAVYTPSRIKCLAPLVISITLKCAKPALDRSRATTPDALDKSGNVAFL